MDIPVLHYLVKVPAEPKDERRTMKDGYYYHSHSFELDIVAEEAYGAAVDVDVVGGNCMNLMLVEAGDWAAENNA
jgi:hypothetical protein